MRAFVSVSQPASWVLWLPFGSFCQFAWWSGFLPIRTDSRAASLCFDLCRRVGGMGGGEGGPGGARFHRAIMNFAARCPSALRDGVLEGPGAVFCADRAQKLQGPKLQGNKSEKLSNASASVSRIACYCKTHQGTHTAHRTSSVTPPARALGRAALAAARRAAPQNLAVTRGQRPRCTVRPHRRAPRGHNAHAHTLRSNAAGENALLPQLERPRRVVGRRPDVVAAPVLHRELTAAPPTRETAVP